MTLENEKELPQPKKCPLILSLVPSGYFPLLRGGLEFTARATLECLIDLPAEGHLAAAMIGPATLSKRVLRKLRGPYTSSYRLDRHHVHTDIYHPLEVAKLVRHLQPAALVVHVSSDARDLVKQVIDLDLPTLFYIHGNKFKDAFDGHRVMHKRRFAAESAFIAGLISANLGEPADIIRPLLDPDHYRVDSTGSAVLVVNPHPKKGGYLLLKIANALPHRTFLVVGGWAHVRNDKDVREVETALAQLPNVQRITHLDDMRVAFRRSRCLLMPCKVEEAYGRAAAEALIAGIPVLASDRGALPETVGSGGITLPFDAPLDTWTAALEDIFLDDAHYSQLVTSARSQVSDANDQVHHVAGQLRRLVSDLLMPGGN